jgi:hypothetical protein
MLIVNIPAGNPERKRPFGSLGLDVRIILEWILRKQGGKMWTA